MTEQNEQLVAGGQVAQAGIDAAAAEPTAAQAKPAARRAVKAKAQEVKFDLSDDDVDRIADALVDKMDERGAFQEPPEQVVAPSAPGQEAQAPGVQAGIVDPKPVKRSWAEQHFTRS